jgi:hypothetical protein
VDIVEDFEARKQLEGEASEVQADD